MKHLSRKEIEAIAARVVTAYKKLPELEGQAIYRIEPELLIRKDILISGSNPYTIEEVDTAVRYVVPEKQTTPVIWNEVTSRTFTNILKKFTVIVTKSDSEKGHAQGDATLGGAVYALGKMQYLSSTPLHNSVIYGKSSSNRQRNGFIGLSPLPGSPPAP